MNVSLSRAKHLLVVVGRVTEYALRERLWMRVCDHAQKVDHVLNIVRLDEVAEVMNRFLHRTT